MIEVTEGSTERTLSFIINHVENESPLILRGDGVTCVFSGRYSARLRTVEEEPPGKRHIVAIIPVDDQPEMSRMITLCLDTIEARGNLKHSNANQRVL